MVTYWLSRNGGAAEGPFTQAQILRMWAAGQITVSDQVCEQGLDDWLPASMIAEEAEDKQRRAAAEERRREMMRQQAQGDYERRKKSTGVAVFLSFLLPGLGYAFAHAWLGAFVAFFLTLGAAVLFLPLALLLWLFYIALTPRAVRDYNERLARELGLL
jgi:hypothetical protein